MNYLRNVFSTILFVLTISSPITTIAQSQQFKFIQDKDFETLLSEKQQTNNNFSIYKNFSLQLYFGDREDTELKYKEFKRLYPNIDATIIYANPRYKLIAGNYKNKIQAEHLLQSLLSNYPNAIVVRLKK